MSSDRNEALSKALKALQKTDRTRAEVVRRLEGAGFAEDVVDDVLRQLDEWGYIDDERVAKREIDMMAPSKGVGKNRIRSRLLNRGVDEELASDAIGAINEDAELAKATALLKKRYSSEDDFGKAGRFLLGRGFEEETVRLALAGHFPAYEEY